LLTTSWSRSPPNPSGFASACSRPTNDLRN